MAQARGRRHSAYLGGVVGVEVGAEVAEVARAGAPKPNPRRGVALLAEVAAAHEAAMLAQRKD